MSQRCSPGGSNALRFYCCASAPEGIFAMTAKSNPFFALFVSPFTPLPSFLISSPSLFPVHLLFSLHREAAPLSPAKGPFIATQLNSTSS